MTDVCTIHGTIIDANGKPQAATGVRVHVTSDNNASIFTAAGELVGRNAISTITDENGYFSMNVVRGLQCVVTVDVLGFAKKVTIPDQPTCQLKDL